MSVVKLKVSDPISNQFIENMEANLKIFYVNRDAGEIFEDPNPIQLKQDGNGENYYSTETDVGNYIPNDGNRFIVIYLNNPFLKNLRINFVLE